MANKPFAIQGADLTLGGVNLSAGTTGVVIPGVTQAANYLVEEVDDRDGTNPNTFGDDAGAVTVIDNAEYVYRSGGAQSSGSYDAATYSVDELDDGEIEEINVETAGVFLAEDKTRAEAGNMWATTTPTPFTEFSSSDWTQIPFRPKMRAGEVENIGGGNADTGNFTFNEDTITNSDGLTLQTDRGTLAMGTNMETPGVAQHFHIAFDGSNSNPPASDLFLGDDYNYVKLPGSELNPATFGVEIGTDNRNLGPQNIEVGEVDELVPPGGVWRLFIDHEDYPNLGSLVSVGDTVTTAWGTPITATITDVVEEPGNWWKIHVAQDITAGFLDEGETVSFGASSDSHTWRFGTDGTLTLPGMAVFGGTDGIALDDVSSDVGAIFNNKDVYITGGESLRFTQLNDDEGNATSVLRFWNTGNTRWDGNNDESELATIRVGNDAQENDPVQGFIVLAPEDQENGDALFKFSSNGSLTFPDGSIQTTAYTGTTGDSNVWVQTFETQNGAPTDIVSLAISVEYDSAGNVIALFNHFNDDGGGSYYSVGKYTTTGAKIWTARFDDEFYTDGWGLAVDNDTDSIYVAGETDVEGQDNATLTKIDSTDGSVLWSKIYDFGFNSQSSVVDVASDGDPVMVGYASNGTDDYVATTKVDAVDGSIIWSRALDGQADEEAYGMAVGPTGEVVAIGYMEQLDETVSHSVTPLTGSATNILVINRSDLSGDILTDTWEVAGTGITGTIGVNAINVYTGLTGTVRQGSGADFTVTDNGNGTYTAQAAIAGTNYLPGHKIKILGTDLGGATPANDCTITIDTITLSGGIVNVSNSGTAAGTEIHVYSVSGTNYQTGSGLTFTLNLDSGSTYTEHTFNIIEAGTNYVSGDVVVVSGTQLGGTSPANDLTLTVNAADGQVLTMGAFSGTQQTTTYRVRTEDGGPDFGGVGTWTLSGTVTDTDNRMLIVKYNSTGSIQWQKAILFDAGFDCSGADADIDSAGNIYVTGSYQYSFDGGTTSALSILKLDGTGAKQWSRRVTGDCDTFGVSVVVGADDKLYLSAMTGNNDTPEYIWVAAKYGIDGTVEWQRLIDNTTGWSFTGGIFFADGGGSNIAVKQDYVLLGGGFGNLINGDDPQATLIQVSASGDVFSVSDWDFKAATFSGVLNGTASDITVVDAGKTDTDNSENITTGTVTLTTEVSGFLLGTLYSTTANNRLFNGSNELVLGTTGTVTLPQGGTITEGYVTSNPTIQLTPATPSVASQKLVIKGGSNYNFTNNGITINYQFNTANNGDTLEFYINGASTYANQTLYWWIYPENANLTTPSSGTIALNGSGNSGEESISFVVDSDNYEFTVRVSPEDNNYDPANVGVESGLINGDEPTFDGDHHLHLTTGDLSETSIFLGTDDHNVRTTVDGKIQITTPDEGTTNVWQFGTDGTTTFPTLTVPISDNATPSGTGQTLKFSDSSQQAIIFGPVSTVSSPSAERIIIQGAPGFTGTTGEGGDVYLWAGPGGSTNGDGGDIKVRAGYGPGTGGGGYLNFQAGDSGTGNGGWINIESGQSNTYGNGGDITVHAQSGGEIYLRTRNSNGTNNDWLFGATGTTTLPGAVVNSTATTPTTTGIPNSFALSPSGTNTNLTPGNYFNLLVGFDGKNLTLGIQVDSNHNISIFGITNVSPATFIIGDSAVIAGNIIGGATPADDLTITVDGLETVGIDLTKTINKLTDGSYTLADGVEGQIMYLVKQTGTVFDTVTVIVANARVAGVLYTNLEHYPFTYNESSIDIDTLIFTDGAWQAVGGEWD